ncbi:MAG: endonuclease/exonuclease/phosphatase family protein, partial [Candidatus Neomarinimicrobiota bacterium]
QLSKPGQVALQVLSDTTLAITWHGEFEKYDSVIIQRKAGEAGWRTNFAIVPANDNAFVDTLISTLTATIYAYRLQLFRGTDTTATTAAVALMSDSCQPATVVLKQTGPSVFRINWLDRSLGETGFRIDRQVGTGSWKTGYALCDSNTTEYFDTDPPTDTAVKYRITALSGTSVSNSTVGSLTLSSLYFGTPETFEVMTWNLLSFPRYDSITVDAVSQAIKALDVDVVGLQEIVSETGFQQLLDSLGTWQGYRANSAAYNIDLAFVYNPVTVTVGQIYEIFRHEDAFPRPPLVIELTWNSRSFIVIDNHYKALGDADSQSRRLNASTILENYIRTNLADSNVIVIGDFNDELTDAYSVNVLWPFLSNPADYKFTDYAIASGSRTYWSYPTYPSHIDHILITNELFDTFANPSSVIKTLLLDNFISGGWNEYAVKISDHRPVALKLAF